MSLRRSYNTTTLVSDHPDLHAMPDNVPGSPLTPAHEYATVESDAKHTHTSNQTEADAIPSTHGDVAEVIDEKQTLIEKPLPLFSSTKRSKYKTYILSDGVFEVEAKYDIKEIVGHGAYGVVWYVHHFHVSFCVCVCVCVCVCFCW
jgi:hypothetical protein